MAIKLTEAEERAIKSKAQEKVNSMTADEVSKKAKSQRITTIISSIAIFLIGAIIGIPAIIDDNIVGGSFWIAIGTFIFFTKISTVSNKDEKIVFDSFFAQFKQELIKEKNGGNNIFNSGFSKTNLEENFSVSKMVKLGSISLSPNQKDNQTVGKILIDDEHQKVIFENNNYYTKAFKFSEIIKYDIYENDQTVVQGRSGSALVGGLFFGVSGAVVGASKKRDVNEQVNILKIIIYVNDLECPKIEFTYVGSGSLSKTSQKYIQTIKNIQEISSYLEYIINNASFIENADKNNDNTISSTSQKEVSKKEQLEELKVLLSDGLITEEDFEQKKKQILDL